ncbi:NAD(P)H-dependent oxidoreductase [Streptomyces sp. NPDC049577]|uniref:NADPH-dependent FMN reductase n=1 Tax=Streptomyces sp. NPDC049577 TaxID=3155153 RepID=UPI003435BF19
MNAIDLPAGTVRVLAISGSLRAGSNNTAILRAAAKLTGTDVHVEVWDGLATVPPFSEDHEAEPAAPVAELRAAITAADALFISTPEYNSSIPGQLKNALDWASRPYGESVLNGKHAAVIGASPSAYGAKWAQAELRKVLTASGAEVVGDELTVPQANTVVDAEGVLANDELRDSLTKLLAQLADAARATKTA